MDSAGHVKGRRTVQVCRAEWDRLVVAASVAAFGAYSAAVPLVHIRTSTPSWMWLLFAVEFIMAGLFLTSGVMFSRISAKLMGCALGLFGHATLVAVVLAANRGVGGIAVMLLLSMSGALFLSEMRHLRTEQRLARQIVATMDQFRRTE